MAPFRKPRNKSKGDMSSGSPGVMFVADFDSLTTVLITDTHVVTRSLGIRLYCRMF